MTTDPQATLSRAAAPDRHRIVQWLNGLGCACGESDCGVPALMAAVRRVVAWADHHQPWDPSGDFAALRAALEPRP